MFVLARMVDTVRIPPYDFHLEFQNALETTLNKKFANKVVLNVGLCICFFDFEKIGESFIIPGDGASHTKVHFRYIVFRPFVDEVLLGKIRSCSKDGIQVSLGFFDDIFVPISKLPENSTYKEADNVWVWNYEVEPGNVVEMFMEPNREIRCRVCEEEFHDTVPSGPQLSAPTEMEQATVEKKASYTITAAMNEPGLGCLDWWTNT